MNNVSGVVSSIFVSLVLLSSTVKAQEYWEMGKNQDQVRKILSGPKIQVDTPEKVLTLKSRLNELKRLSEDLKASDRLPIEIRLKETDDKTSVLHTTFDPHGRISSLQLFGEGGLTLLPKGKDPAKAVKGFILKYPGLFDFQGSTLKNEEDLTSLKAVQIEELKSPLGKPVVSIRFSQTYKGVPVLDGDVVAVFWDGRLAQISGTVINAASSELTSKPNIETKAALSYAKAGAEKELKQNVEVELFEFGVDLDLGKPVYLVSVREVPEPEVKGLIENESYTAYVDGITGEVIDLAPTSHEFPSRQGRYRVYRPRRNSPDPRVEITTLARGFVSVNENTNAVYPWLDALEGRSPVPVYHNSRQWGGRMGFHWHRVNAGMDFTHHLPGHVFFQSQHASFWTQRASITADINFRWWPAHRDYQFQPITVITGRPSQTRFGEDGCWNLSLWRNSDGAVGQQPRVGCIMLGTRSGAYDGNRPEGRVNKLGIIFHEYGHAVDWKYHGGRIRNQAIEGDCDPNTSEEARSLAEAVANLYQQTMYLQEFGRNTTFTDYDVVGGRFDDVAGNMGIDVHMDQESLKCHASTGSICNHPTNVNIKYQYGEALVQAYWEAAHGVNCHGADRPCTNLQDGADENHARWAFFYASKFTGRRASYREFVACFLTYYFRDVGRTEWNHRWWIFNHHGLVGPDYGYSACHSD